MTWPSGARRARSPARWSRPAFGASATSSTGHSDHKVRALIEPELLPHIIPLRFRWAHALHPPHPLAPNSQLTPPGLASSKGSVHKNDRQPARLTCPRRRTISNTMRQSGRVVRGGVRGAGVAARIRCLHRRVRALPRAAGQAVLEALIFCGHAETAAGAPPEGDGSACKRRGGAEAARASAHVPHAPDPCR